MYLTIQDFEKVQHLLQSAQLDYQMELQDGKIVIMGPSDIVSSEITIRLSAFLFPWIEARKLGRLFDSSGGFILSEKNLRAPDISFVCAERLQKSPRSFGQLVPDLVVEIKSSSDRIKTLEKKIKMYLQLAAKVGVLIDPDELTVTIYRSESEPTVLNSQDTLAIPELFPGWELPVAEIWPPVFD